MNSRNASLDILRAVAILLVLGRHMSPYAGSNILIKEVSDGWIKGGWVGVDLFFVLSGFLISGLLFKEQIQTGGISFKHFFIRRGFKIYPPFYFMLLMTIPLTYFNPRGLLSEVFFSQDYVTGLWGATWSLGVEEKFYILFPIFLILMIKMNQSNEGPFKNMPAFFLIAAVGCLTLRILNAVLNAFFQYQTHLFPFHLRFDSLFCGVVVSYFYHYHTTAFKAFAGRYKLPLCLCGLVLCLPAFWLVLEASPLIYTVGLLFFYLGGGLVLISLIDHKFSPSWLNQGAAFIGKHSYSIYLWHLPMVKCLHYYGKIHGYFSWPITTLLYFVMSISLGILLSRMIEYPMLRIRDRLFPSMYHAATP